MRKKIFRTGFLASMLAVLFSMLLVLGVLYNYFEEQMFRELKTEAGYLGHMIEDGSFDSLEELAEEERRVTLIAEDGTVLDDTMVSADEMENHANRREVSNALAYGTGSSTRYSDTLLQKTLYYAVRLADGSVLRISATENSIVRLLIGLFFPFCLVVCVTLIGAWVLSRRLAAGMIRPFEELDLEHPQENETYEELSPLLRKLSMQKETIDGQIREAKQSREEFRLITENMQEGFLVIDKDAKVLSFNTAALRLLEIKDAEAAREEGVLTFNRSGEFRRIVRQVLEGERTESDLLLEEKHYRLIANPVYQEKQVIGGVLVIIDVTESARREQLRREFTSNVSHELKTPLTSISGFAELMKEGGVAEPMVKDFSASIYEEAQRMITLVSDIMKLSELDEGVTTYEKEATDLYALAKEVVKRLEPVADKQQVQMKVMGKETYVICVKKILDEMIYNLCENAIKYNHPNGSVEIIVEEQDYHPVIRVKDTGIGIPVGEQNRIFERFYRVEKSRTKEVGGTGLGLSIVKHGALFHQARIQLESEEGVGTNVSILF